MVLHPNSPHDALSPIPLSFTYPDRAIVLGAPREQDAKMFRRKRWKYLILDEAHMIKNWKSMRWQTLLRFNSKRRLLITGTPLQVRCGGVRGARP